MKTVQFGRRVVLLAAVLGTIGCDRITKHAAEVMLADRPARSYFADTVRVGYIENRGGFLSLGATWPPLVRTAVFVGATGAALVAMAVFGIRFHWTGWPALGVALFVSGGASNWIDRVARGSVVDFLNVGIGPLRTGVFNVADVALMLGAALVVRGDLRRRPDGTGHANLPAVIIRLASAACAFIPFAFALMRSVETEGRDLRYLWVAVAAFVGAMVRMALAARGGGRRMTRGTLAAGVFFMSTLFAVVAAWLLGTAVGPAMFIVGAGFGFCFALSTFLRMPAR